jgi:hypothetical protein
MVDYWSPRHYANVDIKLGAYVRTEGVNTNPANDDQRWWISYTFYDSAGALIGETKLPINQTQATSGGWIADTNAVGQTILPQDAWRTIIKFVGGKDATGTVWADDFIFIGRGGAWAGQDWNTGVGLPTGWLYWFPPVGGNDGVLSNGFENTRITSEAAYTGMYSLKFNMPSGRAPHDGFAGTKRYLLANGNKSGNPNNGDIELLNVNPGDVIRISVWVKASNLVPDSANLYPVTWAAGFTYGFFKGNGNNDGFNNIDGYPRDTQFKFPSVTSFDWTQYYLDVEVPNNPEAKALEVRLHIYARFEGTIYFDELTVEKIGTTGIVDKGELPTTFELATNYPNPFNPSTTINYSVPQTSDVSLVIYNILGKKVRTLINNTLNRGNYNVVWDGKDDNGYMVSSGIYFYSLNAGNISLVKKMILMK